jgi:hypothetical protein
MLRVLIAASAAALLGLWSASPPYSAGFDTWSIYCNSVDNHFDSGPAVATSAGSNTLGVGFSNTVFSPGTPILEAVAGKLSVAKILCGSVPSMRSFFSHLLRSNSSPESPATPA